MSGPTELEPDAFLVELEAWSESLSAFEQSGERIHLQNAIHHGQTALSMISSEWPGHIKIHILLGLAKLFSDVYNQSFDLASLDKTIKYSQEAVDLTPVGDADRAGLLNTLSIHLSRRYEREGKLEDLTQAIEYSQEAFDLTPVGNPNRAGRLGNLSNHLSRRYEREGKLEDLTQAIEYSQEAFNLTPVGNPDRAKGLGSLSLRLSMRYDREGKLEDLTQAIEYSQEAVDLTPVGNPNRVGRLGNLSNHLSRRYEREGKLEDLTQAIEYGQEAFKLTPVGNPDLAKGLGNLSLRLSMRYEREGKLEDLTQAIEYSQEAVDLTPVGDADRAGRLNSLSVQLSTRYEREGKLEDLTQAIEYSQEAVDLTPAGSPHRASHLSSFSARLSTRYERDGQLEDLTQAIEYSQEAVDLTPVGNPDRAAWLYNLSNRFRMRYEREGKLEDLTQAIEYSQEAVDLTPAGSPHRASHLSSFSAHLSTRYERDGQLEDLTQAIEYSQEAVDLTPANSPNRAMELNILSNHLSWRYEREGKLEDLTQAIEYSQEAVDLTPVGNPDQASRLNNLSNHLSTRYEIEGKLEDLMQAIEFSQEAVDLTPADSPDRATLLNNLSSHLSWRYEREGKLEDLTQAIEYSQEAVDLTPVGNPGQARHLTNLSAHLSTRYEREGKLEDLTQAIEYSQEAVDLTFVGNPDRAAWLHNLSSLFRTRYKRKGKLEDLTQAIEFSQEAVDVTPVDSPHRPKPLCSFSINLNMRYERDGKLEDFTQAIEYSQEAVDLTPADSPDRAMRLNILSNHLNTRYQREGKLEDLTQTIENGRNALKCLNSPLSQRLHGCRLAIYFLAQLRKWHEAQEMLNDGLEIFPFLISNLNSKLDQENMMKSVAGIAAMGCAVSLQCDNDGYKAVRILELSRGAINRMTINPRADISTLYHLHPDLAKRFEDLRFLINAPTEASEGVGKFTPRRESIMSELNELISKIRTKAGFEDFQNLPSKDELFETHPNQVTVLLNTNVFRTDALLIHSNKQVQILPLDQSIFQSSKEYYDKICNRFGLNDHKDWSKSNIDMRDFLKWLWDQVVGPIFDAFNFEPLKIPSEHDLPDDLVETARLIQHRQADGPKGLDPNRLAFYRRLMKRHPNITSSVRSARSSQARFGAQTGTSDPKFPRIHWIGVGYMSVFPFHAAGYGSQDARKNTMSCAISSYASTLTARAYAKQKPVELEPSSSALLLVTMPETPNQNDLPGVEEEAEIIQKTVEKHEKHMAVKHLEMQRVNVVLDDLPLYNYVHFACHGYADPQSPFQSGLILLDGALTVETISEINTERSQLAFLSACCTAENASLMLMDEGIHLANGFQLAGYPHVIASLWEADDDLSVAIAEKFYRILFAESNIDGHERRHERIASALHDAVLSAQQIVRHGRQILDDPLFWATTIHIGP